MPDHTRAHQAHAQRQNRLASSHTNDFPSTEDEIPVEETWGEAGEVESSLIGPPDSARSAEECCCCDCCPLCA